MRLYFTRPIPRPALWGGKRVREYFGFPQDFGDDIGQAWAFSAQESAPSPILNPECEGRTLLDLWREMPRLFQSGHKEFPYIISLVAPLDDLSIQVHPDDEQAKARGYSQGKNEAWVFLKAPEEGNIVYGHNAPDEAALRHWIKDGQWDRLTRYLPIEEDDAVYIPAGTLHALRRGSVVYEIQQATDVTYRFYDYDRTDAQGRKRPLQVEDAIACLHDSRQDAEAKPAKEIHVLPGGREIVRIRNDSFVVRQIQCASEMLLRCPDYQLATVTAGQGMAGEYPVHTGCSFLIPAGSIVPLKGSLTLLTTAEK